MAYENLNRKGVGPTIGRVLKKKRHSVLMEGLSAKMTFFKSCLNKSLENQMIKKMKKSLVLENTQYFLISAL